VFKMSAERPGGVGVRGGSQRIEQGGEAGVLFQLKTGPEQTNDSGKFLEGFVPHTASRVFALDKARKELDKQIGQGSGKRSDIHPSPRGTPFDPFFKNTPFGGVSQAARAIRFVDAAGGVDKAVWGTTFYYYAILTVFGSLPQVQARGGERKEGLWQGEDLRV
jgi:hypothetical protein